MPELNAELYKKLYLIRKSEEEIVRLYDENEMKTPMHMSMGAEAISVGVCHALKKEDQVFGTYRSHALYLAKTRDTDDFFAELYGKDTALLKGKGGSMHLCSPACGVMGTSAIVASMIPVAVGAAFANQYLRNKKNVAVFFGDGAVDEGVFWESLNAACVKKIPVLFVCEDNDYAVHTHVSQRHGYKSITDIASRFNCRVFRETTTDVGMIYNLASEAVRVMRTERLPCFLHLKYYRYLEHVGIKEDFDAGYRSHAEFEKWLRKDPLKIQRRKLIRMRYGEERIKKMERDIDRRIGESISRARMAKFAGEEALYHGVY